MIMIVIVIAMEIITVAERVRASQSGSRASSWQRPVAGAALFVKSTLKSKSGKRAQTLVH